MPRQWRDLEIHYMKLFFSWIFQSVKMKTFCGVTYLLVALSWKTDPDRTGCTGHRCGCLSVCLCEVLGCWLRCELLWRLIAPEAWSLGCLPPSLPCSFSAVWVSRDYKKPWLLGKSDTAWLILPHKELQHLEVLLQSGVESICYNLVHSNKYFTFLIWNGNTCCKNTQPQTKCLLMWMYTSP